MNLRSLTLATIALLAVPAVASAAPPSKGKVPCVPGTSEPLCDVWTGKVKLVADGDTVDVDLDEPAGAHRSSAKSSIRITGLQAMEMTVYSHDRAKREGDCMAVEAANRLEDLVKAGKRRVRITAQDPNSRSGAGPDGRNRPRRSVAVRIGGQWVDVGSRLIEEGLALWLPAHTEPHWNARYQQLAQEAAAARRGIWGGALCDGASSPEAQLQLWVNWDADSNDGGNLNDEWIRIKNLDPVNAVSLGGWFVRDSDLRRKRKDDPSRNPGYTLPSNAVVPAGGSITIRVGQGVDTPTDLYWGETSPVFENVDGKRGDAAIGDGAYLFDGAGNLRAWMQYTCRVSCVDPLQGKVRLAVDHSSKVESFTVENVSGELVNLEGYTMRSYPRAYHFPAGTLLQPGQKLRVEIGSGADTALHKYWTVPMPFFKNNGPLPATLETYDGIRIDCFAWGRGSC